MNPSSHVASAADLAFYHDVLERLLAAGIPFLVGGAYAFRQYTGIERHTRDFDVFMLPEHARAALERLAQDGYRTCLMFPHWLGKVVDGDRYVDVIFSSGNGVARVDPVWFQHSTRCEMFGHQIGVCPVEEMIWSKAFIMERERFDGADVIHLIHAARERMDWERLVARFGPHGRVLLAHLVLYGFVYPDRRDDVPRHLMDRLIAAMDEPDPDGPEHHLCRGTLLSRSQYLPDLDRGRRDARRSPPGPMTAEEIERWTDAADRPLPRG